MIKFEDDFYELETTTEFKLLKDSAWTESFKIYCDQKIIISSGNLSDDWEIFTIVNKKDKQYIWLRKCRGDYTSICLDNVVMVAKIPQNDLNYVQEKTGMQFVIKGGK